MQVEPAHIDQLRETEDGDWVLISADAGGVAADLKRIDAGFRVRFSKRQGFWAIFHQHHDGCPHNGTGGPGSTYLVLTAKAYQTASGTWAGLDDRIVKEIERTNPQGRGGYNLVDDLDRRHREAEKRRDRRFHESVGEFGEIAAHALRKDLGARYKGRVFKPREI